MSHVTSAAVFSNVLVKKKNRREHSVSDNIRFFIHLFIIYLFM